MPKAVSSFAARLVAGLMLAGGCTGAMADPAPLRVCAPSDNFPVSDKRRPGFENKLAALVAGELGTTVAYSWWPARENFLASTLKRGICDVVMGVPAQEDDLAVTKPYYRSGYVLVTRQGQLPGLTSLADKRLRERKIGVYVIGDNDTPPAAALSEQGLARNLIGFMTFFDRDPAKGSKLLKSLESGKIDVAAVWGPLIGYEVVRRAPSFMVQPIADQEPFRPLVFQYDISMGVRQGNLQLRDQLDQIVARKRPQIEKLLREYGVPLLPSPP